MSTFSRRFSVRILALLLVFSLVYAPTSFVSAQPDGGSSDGNAGGTNAGSAANETGFSEGSNPEMGGSRNAQAQREAIENNADTFSGASNFSGGFFSTLLDLAIMVFGGPFGIALSVGNFAMNVANQTNLSIGERVFGGTSLVGQVTREVTESLGVSPSAVGAALSGVTDVSFSTTGEMTTTVTDSQGQTQEVTSDFLSQTGSTDWVDYVTDRNQEIDNDPNPNVEAQTVSLSVSLGEVDRGGSTTLVWDSPAGSVCYTQGYNWGGVRPAQGSVVVSDIQEDQAFLIQCTRQIEISVGGDNTQPVSQVWTGLAHAEVRVRDTTSATSTTPGRPQTVQPQPVQTQAGSSADYARGLSISASPSSVGSGGQSTFSWSAEGNSSCSFSGGWPGSSAEGSARVGRDASAVSTLYNIMQTSTYTLSCVGVDGVMRTVSATVNVQ